MQNRLNELIERHPQLLPVREQILCAAEELIDCYRQGNKILVCGNGGSCSDSDHIVGELMKGFEKKRLPGEDMKSRLLSVDGERGTYLAEKLQQALPAISLTAHHALITAVANDNGADLIFAQQIMGYGNEGDLLIAITTSGNSRNVVDAAITAKAKGLTVIGLTGGSGGKLASFCDILINVPGTSTAHIQELHLPVYHAFCQILESHFF
ncbi:MAG: SIS domain-containing protein [Prolixibacteraceae bacterium]